MTTDPTKLRKQQSARCRYSVPVRPCDGTAKNTGREHDRRTDNGKPAPKAPGLVLHSPVSRSWNGYWRRAE